MSEIASLLQGFQVALTPFNLTLMLVGIVLGVIIGVLPGLGGANGVAILLPLTFSMNPTSAIIMLTCIYWGALFGGAITSILFNIPGEPWSVATTFDGYPMAQRGRAGEALAAAFTSSFVGALFAVLLITLLAPLVAQFALKFGPPEFFAVYLLTFCAFVGMNRDAAAKTLVAMAAARRLAAAGERTLMLCFNVPLGEHLAAAADGFTVRTFHALCLELAARAGLAERIPAQPTQAFYEDEAPRLLAAALARLPDERWDAVVVDEAQDFRAAWWGPTRALLRDEAAGRLLCFLDPAQDVYGGAPAATDGFVQARLDYNCRNTARIAGWACRHVDAPTKLVPGTPDGDAVAAVAVPGVDEAAMVDAVAEQLRRLLRDEGLAPERVVVLSAHGRARSAVWRAGHGRDGLPGAGVRLRALDDADPTAVRFSSVHRFKGLEADAVVLCELAADAGRLCAVLRYIGGTRAKHWLAVCAYEGGA